VEKPENTGHRPENTGHRLVVMEGLLFLLTVGLVIATGIEVAAEPSDRGSWFSFVVSVLLLLLCIPMMISALRNHPHS